MSIESKEDPWLSPNRQAEFPSRLVLSTVKLHRRREKTFLVLAAMVILSAVAMPLFGTSLLIDVNHAVASVVPGLQLPVAELAFGVLVMPIGMFAVSLVVELYGRRRAYAMAVVGFLASLAAIGLLYASTRINEGGEIGEAVALSIAAFVSHLVIVPIHSNMRRRTPTRRTWARKLFATLVGQLAAWTVFAFVLYAHAVQMYGRAEDTVITDIGRLVLGGAAFTVAVALVDLVPFIATARALSIYLRVGQFEEDEDEDSLSERSYRPRRPTGPRVPVREGSGTSLAAAGPAERPRKSTLPPALVVETPPPMRRDKRTSIQPFSSAEMRFFTEGEELSEASVEPTDSKSARA